MKNRKIPVSFNPDDLKILEKLSNLFNYGRIGDYGAIAKTLKLSIRLVENMLDKLESSIPDFETEKLDIILSSIKKLKELKYNQKEIKKLEKKGKTYTSQKSKK